MKLFYSLGVNLYTLGIHIASLWNTKAKKWVRGRKNVWKEIDAFQSGEHVYWFHCASLGEFEQGRPLMESIKDMQDCQIVVTFFSPSGYEIRKNYEGADLIIYLPKDSKRNAKRFLEKIRPNHVFFIKYEFWANYLLRCQEMNIPTYSVAALFRKDQIFFKFYGGYMRSVLKSFNKIFVQNEASQQLLKGLNIDSEACGDTRFDRVMKNAQQVVQYSDVQQFCEDKKVLVCGSIWAEDLEVIYKKVNDLNDWKIIVAPHEISENFIEQIEGKLSKKAIRYSNVNAYSDEEVLIIDNIGMLMNLYQYGNIAYVGGAFRTGLHNILEPAAFGLPVFFGPRFEKFPEAYIFLENLIGYTVKDSDTFYNALEHIASKDLSQKVIDFMDSQTGATDKILGSLQKS